MKGMPQSPSYMYSYFFEVMTERMTWTMGQHCDQRTKDQDARQTELAIWDKVWAALLEYYTTGQVWTSDVAAKTSHTNEGCDSMVMADCAGTPDSSSCDCREHDDGETLESEEVMLEAALSGFQIPPGLVKGGRIPKAVWDALPRKWQNWFRAEGKRRRQAARRQRYKHSGLRWQARQHGLCGQQLPHPYMMMFPEAHTFVNAMRM